MDYSPEKLSFEPYMVAYYFLHVVFNKLRLFFFSLVYFFRVEWMCSDRADGSHLWEF